MTSGAAAGSFGLLPQGLQDFATQPGGIGLTQSMSSSPQVSFSALCGTPLQELLARLNKAQHQRAPQAKVSTAATAATTNMIVCSSAPTPV